jgi:hypothetical protein
VPLRNQGMKVPRSTAAAPIVIPYGTIFVRRMAPL